MADNFNLRQFLTENKLTKNAKLLNENADISGYWVMYGGLNKGVPQFIKMFPSEEEAQQALQNAPTTYGQHVLRGNWGIQSAQDWLASGKKITPDSMGYPGRVPRKALSPEELRVIRQLDFEAEMEREGVEKGVEHNPDNEEWEDDEPFTGKYVSRRDIEENAEGDGWKYFDHDAPQGDSYEEVVAWLDDKYPDASQYDKFVAAFKKELRNLPQDKKSQWTAKFKKDYGSLDEAKSYKTSPNSKEAQQLKKGDILTSGDEVVSVSAGAKTPSGKVEVTVKTKSGKTKTNTWGKTTKVGVKEKETVKESTLSPREKYLTRLVENALGIAPQAPVSEDEMVTEKPIPSYKSIEELMKNIDHGTNEAACKYKMTEMKRIAQALEEKVNSLEEGEGAEFVDTKKVKQMKKDIMTLRKQADKLEKEYEKKFGEKKSKKQTQTENKMENFNLKKFLVENKLTTNSRMLNENKEELSYPYGQFGQEVKDIFDSYGPEEIQEGPDIVFELIDELIQEFDLDPMEGEINVDAMEAKLLELYRAAQTMDTEKFGEFVYNELSDASLFL